MESQGLGKAFHGGEHYENFPVGSWLVPAPMRSAVLALYRFARTADDLADEGSLSVDDRLDGLKELEDGLLDVDRHTPSGLAKLGVELRRELDAHNIPTGPAQALLSAFRQDAHNPLLETESEVLDYCSRSANPIGQLVLAFAGLIDLNSTPCDLLQKSNAICTGLQLANFAQDMGQDFSRGRIYVPQSWTSLRGPEGSVAIQPVIKMAHWAQENLAQGKDLPALIRRHPRRASLRLALEIALTIEGGKFICKKVLANPSGVWQRSPTLTKKNLPVILLRSLFAL